MNDNENLGPRHDENDAWVEALLRRDAAGQGHIADDGFCSRVMQRLPERRPAPRWIVPLAALLGSLWALLLTPAASTVELAFRHLAELRPDVLSHAWVLVPIVLLYVLGFGALRER